MERRYNPTLNQDNQRISGLAAVFYDGTDGTQFELGKDTVERIHPKAFDRALKQSDDAVALFNHDPSNLLGRVSSGTLKLEKTKRGLAYSIQPSETRLYSDVLEMVRRGDIRGSSFGFIVEGENWKKEKGLNVRMVTSVRLVDISPVTFPAYAATEANLRDIISYQNFVKNRLDRFRRRLRIIQLEDNGIK